MDMGDWAKEFFKTDEEKKEGEHCEWIFIETEKTTFYETRCIKWVKTVKFTNGYRPKDYLYCPYCGRSIVISQLGVD